MHPVSPCPQLRSDRAEASLLVRGEHRGGNHRRAAPVPRNWVHFCTPAGEKSVLKTTDHGPRTEVAWWRSSRWLRKQDLGRLARHRSAGPAQFGWFLPTGGCVHLHPQERGHVPPLHRRALPIFPSGPG